VHFALPLEQLPPFMAVSACEKLCARDLYM
jgi:hypothetical protein